MKQDQRKLIHIGINFLTTPRPNLSKQKALMFQQAILSSGLEYSNFQQKPDRIILIREDPSPLHITVISGQQLVGQVLAVAPLPKVPMSLFADEAKEVVNSFEKVWPAQNRQIIGGDIAIRELHETSGQHAFQELWENRLGQEPKSLSVFDRPIRGGGIRFLLEPDPREIGASQFEIKIESYFQDTTKIFVETQSRWQNNPPRQEFLVDLRLKEINDFIKTKVHRFLKGATSGS